MLTGTNYVLTITTPRIHRKVITTVLNGRWLQAVSFELRNFEIIGALMRRCGCDDWDQFVQRIFVIMTRRSIFIRA